MTGGITAQSLNADRASGSQAYIAANPLASVEFFPSAEKEENQILAKEVANVISSEPLRAATSKAHEIVMAQVAAAAHRNLTVGVVGTTPVTQSFSLLSPEAHRMAVEEAVKALSAEKGPLGVVSTGERLLLTNELFVHAKGASASTSPTSISEQVTAETVNYATAPLANFSFTYGVGAAAPSTFHSIISTSRAPNLLGKSGNEDELLGNSRNHVFTSPSTVINTMKPAPQTALQGIAVVERESPTNFQIKAINEIKVEPNTSFLRVAAATRALGPTHSRSIFQVSGTLAEPNRQEMLALIETDLAAT